MRKLRIPKSLSVFFLVMVVVFGGWLGLLYRTYGWQTLQFLLQAPPEFILSYTKNMFVTQEATEAGEVKKTSFSLPVLGKPDSVPEASFVSIPNKYMMGKMSHAYQKLNNCGPVSVSMAASVFGVNFDQFFAADILKGSYYDKNVTPVEMVDFLKSQGLEAIYRVNGNERLVEQLVAQNIPVIAEQWLVKRGSGEYVGHFRVVRGYDQGKKLFTTNDSFNGPNFVIPYSQFDEWWRPFNRGYIVVYQQSQTELVKGIMGKDWFEERNWQGGLENAQEETKSVNDGYSYFNVGTNAVYLGNFALAKSSYDKALGFSFPEYFLWYQLGPMETYYQLGEYERVVQMADRLLAAAGETEEARYYRGLVFLKQGKKSEAKVEFEKALAANARYKPAAKALEEL